MIKANELRIGNLVLQDGKMKSVNYIDAAFVYKFVSFKGEEFNADNLYADRECEPIPLTEEILVKLGFEKTGFVSEKIYNYYSLRLSNDKYVDLCLITNEEDYRTVTLFPYDKTYEFKYLHQLQNIYFALTGQELTVNI